jgi:hypothetical protein
MSLENWRKLLRIAFERLENTEFLVRESYRVRDGNLEIDRHHLRIEGQFTNDMPNPMSTEQQPDRPSDRARKSWIIPITYEIA